MQDSVSVVIAAEVADVWALVSDVTRIGEFSPETFEAEWLDGATGPVVGARFRGHVNRNNRGVTYWSQCLVTECVEHEVFGFAVQAGGKTLNNWKYELRQVDGGTEVTESFRLQPTLANRIYWAGLGRWRGETNRRGMRETLEAMRAVLESDA
ncbi:MAG: SRPBCC family protein [Actinomycetota bacterium]